MNILSVLIVEDEAMTAMFMKAMLIRQGYNVLKCISTGEAAVDFAIKFKPDLVLMDIRLAGKMDGIEAAELILADSAETIQFVFTTGYSDIEIKEKAMDLNPLGFFTKPVNFEELVKLVESFFSK